MGKQCKQWQAIFLVLQNHCRWLQPWHSAQLRYHWTETHWISLNSFNWIPWIHSVEFNEYHWTEIQFSSDISHDTSVQFNSVQSLSHVQLFVTQWIAACQASLSITNSQSLFKLMSIESVTPSNHLILCCPLLLLPSIFPSIRVFSNELAITSGGQSIGASASAPVLPDVQDSFSLGWTGLISLQSKGLLRVFSNTAIQKHQLFCTQFFLWSNSHIHTWLLENHIFDYSGMERFYFLFISPLLANIWYYLNF